MLLADFLVTLLAMTFIATPLALAFVIDFQVCRFQVEAFGHLQRAARNLRWTAWTVFVYYVGVLAGSWWVGDLHAMFTYPVAKEGIAIYIRIGAAVLGYAMMWRVARELYQVTRPGPLAPGAPD